MLRDGERLLSLSDLRREIGIDCCQKTIYRWCTEGTRGFKLEHIHGTNGLMTSVEAYRRFMERIQP